ncbi:hypothetical protein ACIRPH_23500, partial [Nocardiopsis sp. NPDC101807]|uniref:hypothetical protein n=1 Tax=Nocardiopsis sp. NPDC101807 TaxID=3364339 RepID=UPI0037F7AC30
TGPKQTWLKENQTRAVEFSRNNRPSRTSAGLLGRLLFRGRRLRFRFVVSLLYQVFRAPPNRRLFAFALPNPEVFCAPDRDKEPGFASFEATP